MLRLFFPRYNVVRNCAAAMSAMGPADPPGTFDLMDWRPFGALALKNLSDFFMHRFVLMASLILQVIFLVFDAYEQSHRRVF